MPLAAALVALIAVTVTVRRAAPPMPAATTVEPSGSTTDPGAVAAASRADDPSWNLMTDLAGDLNWDAAVEAGLTAAGGVDRAVYDLNADERRELERLLKEELARSGA